MDFYYQALWHLSLSKNPTEVMHAVTKQYVDGIVRTVYGSELTSGTVPRHLIPQLSGDLQLVNGNTDVELKDVLALPGIYGWVQVDASGRVVGNGVTAQDLASIHWQDILGRPSTLEGYGITDAISTDHPVTAVSVKVPPQLEFTVNTAVTKEVADRAVADKPIYSQDVGEVAVLATTTPEDGFLRANGGAVDKLDYSALYAVIGDYFSSEYNGVGYMGQPWRQQHSFNKTDTGAPGAWQPAASLLTKLSRSQCVVTNHRAYLIGGTTDGVNCSRTVWTSEINSEGHLGAWESLAVQTSLKLVPGGRSSSVPKGLLTITITGRGEDGTTYTREVTPEQPYIPPSYDYVWEPVGQVEKNIGLPPKVVSFPTTPPTAAGQSVKTVTAFNASTGQVTETNWTSSGAAPTLSRRYWRKTTTQEKIVFDFPSNRIDSPTATVL